jgi:transcription elongation factor Elf1
MNETSGEPGAPEDRTAAGPAARARPFYCPYCGEEDFVPIGEPGGGDGFHCWSCDRRFAVRFLGLGAPPAPADR